MAVAMLVRRLLLVAHLKAAFLTVRNKIILIQVASVEIPCLQGLLAFAAILRFVDRVV